MNDIGSERRRILALILIMTAVAGGVAGIALFALYETAFEQQRGRLIETAQSQARLMEAVARFDAQYSTEDVPGGAFAATLGQIRDAHLNFTGFGETGEFVLARREGDLIVFLLSHRLEDVENPEPLPFSSELAGPMRRALSGESGTIVDLDYRGATVLAAYEPVAILNLGMVAKIDVAEIRAPFVKTGLLVVVGALLLISIGTLLFRRIGDPLIQRLMAGNAALRTSEKQYRDLVETSNDLIWSVDADGCWTFLNRQAAKRIWGYDVEEMLGRPFTEFQTAEQAAEDLKAFGRIKAGESVVRYETVHLRKDGSPVRLNFNAIVLRDEQGNVIGTTGTASDITEQSKLEAQLLQAQKMEAVGRLAGGVAHDFNNLLTVIVGESEMALADLPEDAPVREGLDEIRQAADRAAGLTRQLLTFSRRQIIEPTVFSLNDLVSETNKMLGRLIGEDIELMTRTDPDLWSVEADRGQMEQVVVNLVVNARDAMPKGGKLVIETANVILDEGYAASHVDVEAGDYVALSVSDSGTGMTEETMAHLFEPFFTTKEKGQGTGLGLATSYGIVKQSGGHIGAYSELGIGTTMKVYLPRIGALAGDDAAPEAAELQRGMETVLLVEDEERVLAVGKRILEGQGYTVLEAADAERALQLMENHSGPLHLLLTDVVLPKMDGRLLAERVKKLRPDVKVLFTSGYTEDVVLKHRLLTHEVALLQKPFTMESLLSKVREVLDAGSEHERS